MDRLYWNPRKKRLEGTYRGVLMEKGVAYQFDLYEGGKVVTCTWDGYVDHDGEPLFTTVDFPRYRYTARAATFFDTLTNVAEAEADRQAEAEYQRDVTNYIEGRDRFRVA